MKLLLLLFMTLFSNAPEPNLLEVRTLFYSSTESSKQAEVLKKKLEKVDEDNPLLLGYKGMVEMVMANHSYNPVNKLAFFSKGKDLLERAIKLNKENVELRFLRFCIQTNAPFFLGYKSSIEEDKKILLSYMAGLVQNDDDLNRRIKEYILHCSYFTEKEKQKFR